MIRALLVVGLVFLMTGCAQLIGDVKDTTYHDAIEATRRNHETRFQWRAMCRELVVEEVSMWRRQATLAEGEGNLDDASEHRKKAGRILSDNFPDLVTVQGFRAAKDAIEQGQANVFPLNCFPE